MQQTILLVYTWAALTKRVVDIVRMSCTANYWLLCTCTTHCYQHCLCNHAYLPLSVHPRYLLYTYLHFGLNLPTHVCYVHAGAWLICYVHALPLHASTTCYVSIYGKYSRITLVHNPQGSTPLRSASQLGHQIIVLRCIEHSQYGITSLECHPKGSLYTGCTYNRVMSVLVYAWQCVWNAMLHTNYP